MLITGPIHGGVETAMAAKRDITARQLCGERVFWRVPAELGNAQLVAIVTRVYSAQLVNLLVLGDGYVDLGAGPGVPIAQTNVVAGDGHEQWSTELDA